MPKIEGERFIPEEFMAFTEQAILNLALKGCKITNQHGQDLTESMVSQKARINTSFDTALERKRNGESLATKPKKTLPRPKPGPAKKVAAKNG